MNKEVVRGALDRMASSRRVQGVPAKTEVASHYRYPGTFPFMDTETDRKIFKGREGQTEDLFNQLLSANLVVLYGRSGIGKTSLLQAGIFQKLRDQDYLPLPVLVQHQPQEAGTPLLEVCWAAIQEACDQQAVKCTSAEKTRLWEFFKTAIFLKHAEPQEPVLVFDQFENIFHAYNGEARRAFAKELGELLGRTPPDRIRARQRSGEQLSYSEAPPSIKVLLSIDEDHLGSLQEFAEYLPGILRNRFRLVPLDRQKAELAIREPARAKCEEFNTPPFEFTDGAVKDMLAFLAGEANEVEPLALQVLCQAIEAKVASRQVGLIIGSENLGGLPGLGEILRDFYRETIAGLRLGRRRKARRLCAEALVSGDRRRLLIHGPSLLKKYRLPQSVLDWLDHKHVLRGVEHLNSSYYELGCDVLIPPVLKLWPRRILKSAGWVAVGVLGSVIVVSLVGYLGYFVILDRLTKDYVKMNEVVNGENGFIPTINDQTLWTSFALPSEALDKLRNAIVRLEDEFVLDTPSELLMTSEGTSVYTRIVKDAYLNKGTSLTQRLANLYQWKGVLSDSKYGYDDAIKTIAAGTALSFGTPLDQALNLVGQGDDDVWKEVSARLSAVAPVTAENAKEVEKSASALADAYQGRGDVVSRELEGDLGNAEKDLKRAFEVAQRLPPDHPNLYSIKLDLADLEFERGHLGAAQTAYEDLLNDLQKGATAASPDAAEIAAYPRGVTLQRMGDVYLENLELDPANDSFKRGSDAFSELKKDDFNPGTLNGRAMIRNKLVFDDRLGSAAMAGYEEAMEILGHGPARALATHLMSKPGQIAPDRKQVIPQEFPDKYAIEGRRHYKAVHDNLTELLKPGELFAYQSDLAEAGTELGGAMAALGDSKAEETLQGAVKLAEGLDKQVNKPAPKDAEESGPRNAAIRLVLVDSLIGLGKFYLEHGEFDVAEKQYVIAKTIAESRKQKAPESIRWQEALAKIDDGFGDIHLSGAELDKARESYNKALEIRTKLSQPDTRSAKRMLGLAVTEYKLASLEELAGKEPKVIEDHRTRATGILTQLKKEGRLPPIAANWPEIFGDPR